MSDLFMNVQQKRLHKPTAAVASNAATAASFQSHTSTHATAATTSNSYNSSNFTMHDNAEDFEDTGDSFENILSLKLRKPKHWKWELTTSRSCTNIALPRILLYDHKGELLVDADSQSEDVYKPAEEQLATSNKSEQRLQRKRSKRALTSNIAQSIRQALDREFNSLQIQEATPSPATTSPIRSIRRPSSAAATSTTSAIDFYTNELPDYKFERRSSSLKGVRFKDMHDNYACASDLMKNSNSSLPIVDLPTPPSTSTTNTTTTTASSSSGGPREKRRYRRSHSSGRSTTAHSGSILERFSFNKGRFSSPEFAEEKQVYKPPRYFLRTSKAGTLVVQEESFSRYRRRRKAKNSSSENIRSDATTKSFNNAIVQSHLQLPTASQRGSLQSVAELQAHSKQIKNLQPVRRYRSDGNFLQTLSTSEEETEQQHQQKHKYANFRRKSKRDAVTIDPDNGIMHAMERPTAR